jgi:hypothetical protein
MDCLREQYNTYAEEEYGMLGDLEEGGRISSETRNRL